MSTQPEVDLFADIETPTGNFWDTILNKETQKLTPRPSENTLLKKETESEDSDDEIKIVKEVPADPPDLVIQGEDDEIEVHSRLFNLNPITNSNIDVDKPLHPQLHKKVLKFRKGHNLHSIFATWGQIDQLSMRKQQILRLMAVGNVVKNTPMSKQSFVKVHQEYYRINRRINDMVREIQQEHKLIMANAV